MNYLMKILIPEISNSRGEFTTRFQHISNMVTEADMISTGLTKNFLKNDEIKSVDLIIVHNINPLSMMVAGMSLIEGIRIISYLPEKSYIVDANLNHLIEIISEKVFFHKIKLKEYLQIISKEGKL